MPNKRQDPTPENRPEVSKASRLSSVELFSGAGGLALGVSQAGFDHLAVVEWDKDACQTLLFNRHRVSGMQSWPVHHCDVRQFKFQSLPTDIDLLAGGVPCQPFSIGGKHKGHEDERNMFPELIAAVRALRPRAVLIENVRGLARPSFAKYFGYIELMLTYPDLMRRQAEDWISHRARLEKHHTSGSRFGLQYKVVHQILNAADFGVPQKRERLFFVAVRADLGIEWTFPQPTHSFEALLWSQHVSGQYWDNHKISRRARPATSTDLSPRVNKIKLSSAPLLTQSWRTVRDAISDLPRPANRRGSLGLTLTHFAIPGARSYAGHTGSHLDEPAKTLKAGVHGVPGGENTLASSDGSVRYFTIRESCRLQTFPDEFDFHCSWTESMRQIGNAVPVRLARLLAENLRSVLSPQTSKEERGVA